MMLGVAIAAPPARGADAAPQAKGMFEGKNWKFEATGAYAFPGKVGFDDEPGIVVAVSNISFNPQKLDTIWDRRYMIDTYFRDEETLVVYFQFSKTGAYKGLSYFFESGDGCAFCYDGKTKSTVKVVQGKLKGRVQLAKKKDDAFFDVTLDVPVATNNYGKKLPADGGEPGKVYAALHTVLDGTDPAALGPIVAAKLASQLDEAGKDVLEVLQEQHPTKSYRIVQGYANEEHALLIVEGETSTINVKTEVHLVREKGEWKFDDEVMQVRFEE
jgi:hypothetical protein